MDGLQFDFQRPNFGTRCREAVHPNGKDELPPFIGKIGPQKLGASRTFFGGRLGNRRRRRKNIFSKATQGTRETCIHQMFPRSLPRQFSV
jgi:hypothetical protein